MKYLIDTHILIWWYLEAPQLPKKYTELLAGAEESNEQIAFSIISLWEIAKLVNGGKLQINFSLSHWFESLEQDPFFAILPLNGPIVLESTQLGEEFPKDPVDQMIVATARHHGLRLMTVDEKIIKSGKVAVA